MHLNQRQSDVVEWLISVVCRTASGQAKTAACEVIASLFGTEDAGWLSGEELMPGVKVQEPQEDAGADEGEDLDEQMVVEGEQENM